MQLLWNSHHTSLYLTQGVQDATLGLHGLELRISHEGPLRDGFDIVVMEAAVNIKTYC